MASERSQPITPIEIALADANPLMLAALSEVIYRDSRFSLVLTAKSAEGFLQGISRAPVSVGLVDWDLPGLGTERLIGLVRGMEQSPRIAVYAKSTNRDAPRRAMAAGAAGLAFDDQPPERLLDTVASVAAGQMVFPFLDVRELSRDPLRSLTHREEALLEALAKGMTNKELSETLGITVNTVKFHLRNLFDKLSVKTRGQAIALYYASGHDRQ